MTTHTRQIDGVILGRTIALAQEYSERRESERRQRKAKIKLAILLATLVGGAFLL